METSDRSHEAFRSRICDSFLVVLAVLAVPTLASSLWRAVEIGWQPVMTVQAALATCLWLATVYRRRLAYRLRAGFLVILFVIIALSGIWTFGLMAGGVAWLVVMPILTTILFGVRIALAIFTAGILVAGMIGAAFITGYRSPQFDLAQFLTSTPAWTTAILSWALSGGSAAIAVAALNKFFFETVDVSRQHAEALEESEREYRNILDNMVDTFYRADHEGLIVRISPSVQTLAGYTPEEVVGRKLTEFYVHPHERDAFLQQLQTGGGRVNDFSAEIFDKAGDRRWVSSSARYWKDADGNVLGVEGTIRDVTAQKQAEDALRRFHKMEAIGQLTGGIAHDFNNLMGVMIGHTELLEAEIGDNKTARGNIEGIRRAVARGESLTQRLLRFSSKQIPASSPTNINAVILSLEPAFPK